MADQTLKGKKIAFLATDGFEQVELTEPWKAIQEAGAETHLVSLKSGRIQGMNHDRHADTFNVDRVVQDASASDYDGLVLPGGVLNPDTLRTDRMAVEFIKGVGKKDGDFIIVLDIDRIFNADEAVALASATAVASEVPEIGS